MIRRRIYFCLLLSAIAGLVLFGAGVPKGRTNQGGIQIIPESWRGTWKVTVVYRNHETGAPVATDVTTAAICQGEPIIPFELNAAARCSHEASDSEIGVSCRVRQRTLRNAGCSSYIKAELDSRRDGDSWSGIGSWEVDVVGSCNQLNYGEDIVVSGTRVSTEAACDGDQSSLIRRFFAHSQLVPVLGGSNLP